MRLPVSLKRLSNVVVTDEVLYITRAQHEYLQYLRGVYEGSSSGDGSYTPYPICRLLGCDRNGVVIDSARIEFDNTTGDNCSQMISITSQTLGNAIHELAIYGWQACGIVRIIRVKSSLSFADYRGICTYQLATVAPKMVMLTIIGRFNVVDRYDLKNKKIEVLDYRVVKTERVRDVKSRRKSKM